MMNRLTWRTHTNINIFTLDGKNVIKRNPAVSYAAEEGLDGDRVDQMWIYNTTSWLLKMIS